MQTRNRLFDDIAKVANSAAGTLFGLKDEIENMVRHRVEGLMTDMNMVTRDEFDAVKACRVMACCNHHPCPALQFGNHPRYCGSWNR